MRSSNRSHDTATLIEHVVELLTHHETDLDAAGRSKATVLEDIATTAGALARLVSLAADHGASPADVRTGLRLIGRLGSSGPGIVAELDGLGALGEPLVDAAE